MSAPGAETDFAQILEQMKAWRHDFHAHPELAFEEERTAHIVAETLSSFGLEVHRGIARTGVVGVLDFGSGPAIGFRADMDALPLREQTGVSYASTIAGVMHACGHDGHTAMLLGAAQALSRRTDLAGRIVFIFQPAEENEGGAKAMIDDGLFRRFPVDSVFGLHNMPGMPLGVVMARAGPVSAAFDTFTLTVNGQGGHGAMPETTRDPIVAAAALTMALNTIVSRNVGAFDPAVVSVGQFSADGVYNVIPNDVTMKGSCRSFSEKVRTILRHRIHEICDGIGTAFGVRIDCRYEERYPPVVNAERQTALFAEALSRQGDGFNLITDFNPLMGSEDFSFLAKERPGCYLIMGSGDTGGPLHSPKYDFNDNALAIGARAWIRLAETALHTSGHANPELT